MTVWAPQALKFMLAKAAGCLARPTSDGMAHTVGLQAGLRREIALLSLSDRV